MTPRLPLLESLGAVVMVALVAALTALPSRSDVPAREDAALQDALGAFRTALFRYTMEHGGDGVVLADVTTEDELVGRLTQATRKDGTFSAPAGPVEDRWYGPYLNRIPVNPVNGKGSVRVMPDGYPEPVLNGTAGWVFVPMTGEVFPDLPGTDGRGLSYAEY